MNEEGVTLDIDDVACRIALLRRPGPRKPVIFMHGFGSTKEDFADVVLHRAFDGRDIVAFDAPGCGASNCADLAAISMQFMKKTLEQLIAHLGLSDFHLVGHSMGGLSGLLYASCHGSELSSFTSIEGNLAPEDCFLSRQIINYPAEQDDEFLESFIERTANDEKYSNRLYALTLKHKILAPAVAPIFRSIVERSDNDDLLGQFIALPCAKMFMFGDANRNLPYLSTLKKHGVCMAEIAQCGHFPMYANPPAMWAHLADFFDQTDAGATT